MRLLLVIVPVIALGGSLHVALGGSSHVASELVGQWTAGGDLGGGHGWSAEYVFRTDGTFKMTGYPQIEIDGDWTLVERKPGKLRIKLTHQKMKAPDQSPGDRADSDDWGVLSPDGKTFAFEGKELHRSAPPTREPPPVPTLPPAP
jgi:hypothetical protein